MSIVYNAKKASDLVVDGRHMREAWINGEKIWPDCDGRTDYEWAMDVFNASDRENYTYKYLLMFYDIQPETIFAFADSDALLITSDGATYTSGETHTWDDRNARPSHEYNGRKARYAIYYTNQQKGDCSLVAETKYLFIDGLRFVGANFKDKELMERIYLCNGSDLRKDVFSTREMFKNCRLLWDVPFMDLSHVNDTAYMFQQCSSLKQVVLYDLRNVTTTEGMFSGCTLLVQSPQFDTMSVINMTYMYSGCTSLMAVPPLNTSKVQRMQATFANCKTLEAIPLLDTSKVYDFAMMFYGCDHLQVVPDLETTNALYMYQMFQGCVVLQFAPNFKNVSKVQNMNSMYSGCTKLQYVPDMNTMSCKQMRTMFLNCISLVNSPKLMLNAIYIPYQDIGSTMAYDMFKGCTAMKTVNVINVSCSLDLSDQVLLSSNITTIIDALMSRASYEDPDLSPYIHFSPINLAQLTAAQKKKIENKFWIIGPHPDI